MTDLLDALTALTYDGSCQLGGGVTVSQSVTHMRSRGGHVMEMEVCVCERMWVVCLSHKGTHRLRWE